MWVAVGVRCWSPTSLPMTADPWQQGIFSTQLMLTGFFFSFLGEGGILWNPRYGCDAVKIPEDQQQSTRFTEYNLTMHLYVEGQSSESKSKVSLQQNKTFHSQWKHQRRNRSRGRRRRVFPLGRDQRPLQTICRLHTQKHTKRRATSHRLGLSSSLGERLGAGGRYANALTDANRARLNADWRRLRVEALLRLPSAENREEAASARRWGYSYYKRIDCN